MTGAVQAGSPPDETTLVLSEVRGAVQVLRFNRPDRLNAWTNALEDEYFDLLEQADADSDVRAVVVTGAGRGFCSGADMADLAVAAELHADRSPARRPRHLPMLLRKPLVGAINGAAAGLGFVEALYCDVRFASSDALFMTSFARRGLIAEYGVSWMLPRLVGRSRAADLLLSGRRVSGEEAYRIGLVDHLVSAESLVDDAVAFAAGIATWCSPGSVALIKEQLERDSTRGFLESVRAADELMGQSFRGDDLAEGIASFAQKRPPRFAPLPRSVPSESHPPAQGVS